MSIECGCNGGIERCVHYDGKILLFAALRSAGEQALCRICLAEEGATYPFTLSLIVGELTACPGCKNGAFYSYQALLNDGFHDEADALAAFERAELRLLGREP